MMKYIVIKNETEGSNVFGKQFAVGDFDANGILELIVGDSEGELFIYESVGDDLLVEKWRMKLDIKNCPSTCSRRPHRGWHS